MPDYGRITTYRSPGGFAIRLDGGNGFGGAVITPYFDSLLVKTHDLGHDAATRRCTRAERSLREFRIRGVKTNIAVPAEPDPPPDVRRGRGDDDVHRRDAGAVPDPRAARPRHEGAGVPRRRDRQRPARRQGKLFDPAPRAAAAGRAPPIAVDPPPPARASGSRSSAPRGSRQWIRDEPRLLVTDTTLRDAHQSLLATRVRTYDMLAIADAVARGSPRSSSASRCGAARRSTRRCASCRRTRGSGSPSCAPRIPNILFQMLLRASNAVGYTNYPDNVVRAFIRRSAADGIDVFRDLRLAQLDREHARRDRRRRARTRTRSARRRSATRATSSIRPARSTASGTT